MSAAEFKILFDGQLVEGADPDQVRVNLASLFKIDVAKVETLFAGGRKMIRRGLDEPTARKFHAAFARAGAVAIIVDASGADVPAGPAKAKTATPPQPPASAPVQKPEPSRASLAEAGRAPPPLAARGQPSVPADMTMAEAGVILVAESDVAQAPDIDTSHLTLSEPGVDLAEQQAIVAPEFDLSTYELAPPGTSMRDET